ncbi:MAG TPA: GNAT family N-acetyltransferase [Flavisolibacter sp.]|jgi:predicted GNAT family N-acyltransferase|nr:GNAT family N-acetyltransferase [Flavisolibacter sp.]
MEIKIICHSNDEYEQMINLRVTQLLLPIGVPASYIQKENEKHDILIGAFENNETIGCCVLTPRENGVIQLRQMTVREDYRGKKIGAAIVQFAEKVARENNFSILMMHARDPVIDFYKKSGYLIAGEQFFEVGMGHHKMQKQLS